MLGLVDNKLQDEELHFSCTEVQCCTFVMSVMSHCLTESGLWFLSLTAVKLSVLFLYIKIMTVLDKLGVYTTKHRHTLHVC